MSTNYTPHKGDKGRFTDSQGNWVTVTYTEHNGLGMWISEKQNVISSLAHLIPGFELLKLAKRKGAN
jgi:hypothetical protein